MPCVDLPGSTKAPIAIGDVSRIDALFAIEREISGVPPQQLVRFRQEQPAARRRAADMAARALRQALGRTQSPALAPSLAHWAARQSTSSTTITPLARIA